MLELDEMLAIARKSPPDDGGLSLDVMLEIARSGGDAPPEELERMAAIFQPPEDLLLRDPAGLGMEPWRVEGENGERINAPLPEGMLPPDPTKANAGLLTEPPKRFSYSVVGTPWERTLPQASWLDRFLNVGIANLYERGASDAARLYNDAINNLNQGASLDPMQIHAELESDPTLFMVPPENLSGEILKRRAQRAKQDMDRNIDKARRWQPTEYARPEGWFQETAAEMLENAPYSFRYMPLSAAATMTLGPGGAFLGAMPGALGEGRDEGNEVYWRLIAKGVPHEEALRQSDAHARWVTSGLMLSDPLQNIATFGAKKLFPNAGGVTRGLGATLFDMFSEGAEEFLESVGGDLSARDPVNWADAWRAGKFGALNGGLMGAGSSATGAAYNAIAQNAQINAVNDVLDIIREQQRQDQVQQKKAGLRENLHNTIEQDRADRKQQAELERIPQTMEKLETEIEKVRKNGDAGRMEALLRYRAWLAERQGAIQSQKSARAEEIQRQDAAEAGQMVPMETPPQSAPLETPPQSSAEMMTAPPQGEPETQVQAEPEPQTQTEPAPEPQNVREAIKRRIMEMQHEQYGEEEAEANAAVAEAFANYVAEATGRTPEDVMREMNPQFVNDPEGRGMSAHQQSGRYPGPAEMSPQARGRLAKHEEKWGSWVDQIDAAIGGKASLPNIQQVDVMQTPEVLRLLGVKRQAIRMEVSKIKEILDPSLATHPHYGMTADILKQVPRAMTDPIAIFDSASRPDALVFMTELKDTDGATVIAAIHIDQNATVNGVTIHKLASSYGKEHNRVPSNGWFVKQVTDGRLRYIDQQKKAQWESSSGNLFPPALTPNRHGHNILTRADLVKAWQKDTYYQSAFSGSPNRFKKFDLSYVGSGEGTQNEGWGHYLSEIEGVGQTYRDQEVAHHNVGPSVEIDGTLYVYNKNHAIWEYFDEDNTPHTLEDDVLSDFLSQYDNDDSEAAFRYLEENKDDYDADEYDEALNFLRNADIQGNAPGSLIKAEIPESKDLIHREISLKEQDEKIQQAVREIADDLGFEYNAEMTGADVQKEIASALGVELDDEAVSLKLLEYGIPGAEYSTGLGNGSNFVIWDDDAIDIVEIYRQSIGKKGAAALDAADAGRRMEDLSVAREMEKAGKDARAIRLATGWERGADGKWRFEILDDGDFNDSVINVAGHYGIVKLSELYDAPELYRAYPELRDMKVTITGVTASNVRGAYHPETRSIELSKDPGPDHTAKYHLVHEIQHAIQHIEGFSMLEKGIYNKRASETEARNASTRMDMTAEERRTSLLADTEDVAREDQIILREALGMAESRENSPRHGEAMTPPSERGADARGYTRFEPEITDEAGNIIQDARTVIGILKNGDKSSIPHELGHVFLEMMRRMSQMENVSEQARADWKTIVDWLRLRDIDFSQELSGQDATRWRNAHEKWSAGFEKYLASGKAPNSRLKAAFEAFKRWMKEIYQKIRNITWTDADGKEHRFDLSKDVREVMDRMMGGAETEAQTQTQSQTQAAPKMAALEHAIAGGGAKAELSLKEDIAQAAETLARIRREGGTVADFLVQRVLSPEMDISPEAKTLLQFFDANKRSAKKIAAALNRYAELALNEGSPNQMSLFETETPTTKGEMLKAALEGEAQDISSLAGKANERINESLPPKEDPKNLHAVAPGMRPDIDPKTNPNVEAAEPATSRRQEQGRETGKTAFEDEETEARYEAAKRGVRPEGAIQQIARWMKEIMRGFRGDYPLLAGRKELMEAQETLRRLNRERGVAVQNTVTLLRDTLKDLSPEEFELFARKRLLDDLTWRKKEVPDAKLPFGLTDQSLEREKARFDRLVSGNEKVMKAIEADEKAVSDVNSQMIELAEKLGWTHLKESLKNPHYFRHQVLEYAQMRDRENRMGVKAPTDRGYLKRYKGSELDINANYIQANGEVRALQMQDIQVLRALVELKEKYDIGERLRAEAKETGKKLKEVIPAGYVRWSPFGRGLMKTADSVAAQILDAALVEGGRQLGLPLDAVLGMMDEAQDAGTKSKMWVIPAELAATLNRVGANKEGNRFVRAVNKITSGWKSWVLFSPTRAVKYNIRNVTGDMDALIAGNPRALAFVKQAWGELADVYFRGRAAEGELHEFQQRGGALTSESVQELYDWRQKREFAHLMDQMKDADIAAWRKLGSGAWKVIDGYWKGAQHLTEFREQILRYACYLSYLDQIRSGPDGKPANWGASNPDEVMSVKDARDRAFKLANELLGAYDQVSETGQQIRNGAVPFYSWLEVNAKRYYNLLKNGLTSDAPGDFAARFLKGQAVKSPLYAYRAAKTVFMLNLFGWTVQAFNQLVMGDDEDDLPPDIQDRPHITLGRDKDGRVLYFDRIGAAMDVLDWFAGDSFFSDMKEIMNGQQTVTGYLKKIAGAPFSKAMNALNPMIKMPLELATKRTYFPDMWNPRTIRDVGSYLASSLGLTWEYRAAAGEPGPKYFSVDRIKDLFMYSSDVKEGAYFYIQDKKREFQERVLGKSFDGSATSRRGNALRRLKTSIRFRDRENIKRSLQQYADAGGTGRGLKSSMDAMNPLQGLSKEEEKQFIMWLTAKDRKFLGRAMDYYRDMRGMIGR